MSVNSKRQRLIKWVRRYPVIALSALALAYLLGGFSGNDDGFISQQLIITTLYLFVGVVPLGFIIAFIVVGRLGDLESATNKEKQSNLSYEDAFDLPSQIMHGYKLAMVTGVSPTLTGLTGDTYLSDAQAICKENPEHIPPVAQCECGFYAYKELADAQFELSINPGAFLLDVDLFGLGFTYKNGFRAESQVVNRLITPKRCMRCRVLPAKVFVKSYKLGYEDTAWWQWQIRCVICSSSFKPADKLTVEQMGQHLAVKIN
ncbi:MAG: hypothetical protein ACO3IO_05560 [Candidatus Nanopelagicus sp.]